MTNYINDIRKINKLINANDKKELEDFLENTKVDLNYYDKTTSPLKVAFNNFFATKDFDIIEILIKNNIDIFDDNFVFKLLKYNKTEEFKRLFNLRKDEIKNFQRGNKTFIDVLANFVRDTTLTHVSSIINRTNDNDRIYTSLDDILKEEDRNYLKKNHLQYKNLVTRTFLRNFNAFTYNKPQENKESLDKLKKLYSLLKEFYSVEEIMKGKSEDNISIDLIRNFSYFLFKNKKESHFDETKIFLINIIDEFHNDFKVDDIKYDNRQNVKLFFNFQNTIQGYKGKKEVSAKVLNVIDDKLKGYKEREIFYPAYEVVFKENLLKGSVRHLKMFNKVNLSKEDMESIITEPKTENNKENIKNLKLVSLFSLLNDSGVKAHKLLHEILQEKGIMFDRNEVLLEHNGITHKIDDIFVGIVEKKIKMVPEFLNFIKNKESYFEHTEDFYNPDLQSIYFLKPTSDIDIKDIKILFEVYKENGVDLTDVSQGTLGAIVFRRAVLRNSKNDIFEEYLKINPKVDKYENLALEILSNNTYGEFRMKDKFDLCSKYKLFNSTNFPEEVLALSKTRNYSIEMKAYLEKIYMQNVIISNDLIGSNPVQKRKRI